MKHSFALALLLLASCNARHGDPPPPASSAQVPVAPPNARGALAAGSAPTPSLAAPTDPEDPEVDPLDPSPGPRPTTEPEDDGGVSL